MSEDPIWEAYVEEEGPPNMQPRGIGATVNAPEEPRGIGAAVNTGAPAVRFAFVSRRPIEWNNNDEFEFDISGESADQQIEYVYTVRAKLEWDGDHFAGDEYDAPEEPLVVGVEVGKIVDSDGTDVTGNRYIVDQITRLANDKFMHENWTGMGQLGWTEDDDPQI
jgi:hypothetical protein